MKKRTSARRAATFLAALGALVMSSGVALMVAAAPANAAKAADCVPAAAYTEVIDHPAVTQVVHHPAVDAQPSQWWNWSPNKDQGPFDGPPSFPTDARGTWEGPHTEGGPDGTGTFNVSNNDNGHSPWFHREAAVPGQDAWDETVTVTPHSTETVNHPAVTCTGVNPPVVCPDNGPKAGQSIPPGETADQFCSETQGIAVVSPPKAAHHTATEAAAETAAVTPTVVEAGLPSLSTKDLRGEQGLALMISGMVMLAAAGGLGLRLRGAASRI